MNSIARRIRRLENLHLRCRGESGPNLVEVLLGRMRKRRLAQGREPETDRSPGRLVDASGRCLSIAEILLENRKKKG